MGLHAEVELGGFQFACFLCINACCFDRPGAGEGLAKGGSEGSSPPQTIKAPTNAVGA